MKLQRATKEFLMGHAVHMTNSYPMMDDNGHKEMLLEKYYDKLVELWLKDRTESSE